MGRVFSGIQPTGILHIGNYLGALRYFAGLQAKHESCLYSVVDMHSITAQIVNPEEMRQRVRFVAASYLACGVDPNKSIIFAQSAVLYHAQLAWILSCVARTGWLARMTQFKDKVGKHAENASVGLYIYPVLMAADILLYNAEYVPVGEDQKQHIELARDIAQKFNKDFSPIFKIPNPIILEDGTRRIFSLRDGEKKMSKSDPSPLSYIGLCDTPDEIANKIRKAKTDSLPFPQTEVELEGRKEVRNLITIYAAFANVAVSQVLEKFSTSLTFSEFKEELIQLLISELCPIGKNILAAMDAPDYIDKLLAQGAQKACAIAQPIYEDVRRAVGFSPYEKL